MSPSPPIPQHPPKPAQPQAHQHPHPSHTPQLRSTLPQQSNESQRQPATPPIRTRQPRPLPSSSKPSSANGQYQPHESVRGRTLTYEDLSRCFHLPINSAAKELGVCVTALKKQCRKHHIKRWPHRKLKSLDKLKEKLEKEEANAADKEYYKHEIHSIVQKKDHIFRSGTNATRKSPRQPDNDDTTRSTPALADQRVPRTSQPFASHEHTPVHGHPPPLMITTPVPMSGRTVTLQAPHPPQAQGAIGPPPLAPVAIPGPPVSLCGILGCDCYMTGGVSSQNYHLPLPARPPLQANNGALVPTVPISVSGPMHTNAPFYGTAPAPYPYATALPYPSPQPTPFQNMVQVNVLEQQPYGHQPGPGSNPSQATLSGQRSAPPNGSAAVNGSPNIIQAGQIGVSQSSTPTTTPNPSPYEAYPPTSTGAVSQPPSGFLYSSFPPHAQLPVDGVVQGAPANGSAAQLVPHYWAESPHTSNRNNLVTMYNQTTHYHHHHPAHAKTTTEGHIEGTASSATNNSDPAESRRHSIRINGNVTSSVPTGPGLSSQDVTQRPTESMSRKRGPSLSDSRPPKFGKSDTGDHTEGGKGAHPNDRGESTREPSRLCPMQDPSASEDFEASMRNEISSPRRESERRSGNPPVGNKNLPKPTEARRTVEGMEQGQQQRKETAAPRIVEKVSSPKRVSRSVVKTDGDGNRVNLTVRGPDHIEGLRSDKGQLFSRIALQKGSRRSPNKRPRSGMVESPTKSKSWEGSYLTAGNTGVPAVRHAEGEVGGLREITPPSDREETPFDPQDNLGSGTGSGSGSGSGSGNENDNADGSREGDVGSGSGDSDGSKEDGGGIMDGPSRLRNGMKRRGGKHGIEWRKNGREEGGNNVTNGAVSGSGNSAVVRARRYEHVVHHCVSLLCAQWCTDKNLRVVISLGSKMLLGLAGVVGHGRIMFEGSEGMLENKHSMQKRYSSVLKGQRLEWVVGDGRKRYLIVLSPFRKRSGAEISGVSGLLMELTQMAMN